ncbi:MAG: tetratricopeptide repeat protein, partial [Bacteroidetes bacterium]|nr:tetratricopeptide repeat protein [Bacteroidota bacterium]
TQAFSEKHPDVAFAYEHLGLVHHGKGDYPKAFEYYHKALIIYDQTLSNNSDEVANIYSYIGNLYNKNGDYDRAFNYLNKALTTLSKKLGECNAEVVWINYDLGDVFLNKRDYEQALSYFNKGLSSSLKTKNYNFVAHGYSKIGHVYLKQNEYEQALKFFSKDLSINLDLFGEGHPYVAESYNKIGNVYFNKGEYVEALEFYNKALINFSKYGEHHPAIAKVFQDIGKVYYRRDDFKRALYYYQKSLTSLLPEFREDNIYVNPSLTKINSEPILLAGLELKAEAFEKFYSKSSHLKDLQLSLSTYELATELIDEMRRGYNAEQTKLFLGEKTYNVYNNAISTAIKLYEITKNEQYKEKAFSFSEKSKTNILLESLSEAKAKQFAGIPETLLEHERQVKIDIAFYQKSIFEEQAKGDSADNAKIVLWQDKFFAYKQEYEKLINKYQEEYPEYYNLKYQVKTTSPGELQNKILDENSALVEYFIGEGSILIFTITKKDFDITEVKRDSSFAGQVKAMRTGLLSGDYDLYTKHAYQLYQTLIEPIKNKIQNKHLFIIPDGILGYIPFETLLSEKPETSKDYGQLSYLIKDYQITYSYSSTLLLETMTTEKTKGNNEYIGFAPVVFN